MQRPGDAGSPSDRVLDADDLGHEIIQVVDEAARRATFTIRELQAQLQQTRSELAEALAALAETQRQKRSLETLCAEVIGKLERGLRQDSPGDLPASSFQSPRPESRAPSREPSSMLFFHVPPPSTDTGAQRAVLWRERLRRELQLELQTQHRVLSCGGNDTPSVSPSRRPMSATSSPLVTRLAGPSGRCSDESPVQWPGP
eukprot:scaffold32821_cov112-Isochrysis_galbana.AAC.4